MATEAQSPPGAPRLGPSDGLMAVFRACSRDPTQLVEKRLRRMLHAFLQHYKDDAGDGKTEELAELCSRQAETWYYRILENLIKQERRRVGTVNVLSLLEDDLVQCCLVACCLEITMCLNRLPSGFPRLLQIFRLAPYHFWRVIELIVLRADVRLPHAVVRHLNQLDQKIVESLAWTSDSALWEDIRAEGRLPTCQQVVPPTQLEDPRTAEVNDDRNPPGAGVGPGAPRRSKPLRLFARKVYSLTAKRLRELCSVLDVGDDLRLKIWTCLEHSLVHCTPLMMDRHLDQMMMCSIYIMAKITKMEIPFRHIMKCYKSQPHADKGVCKNVLISGDEDKSQTENHMSDDGGHSSEFPTPSTPSAHYPEPCQQQRAALIHFYNQDFTTKIQDFATLFVPTSGGDTPPLSPYPQQRRPSPRKQRLSGSRCVFVSSLNRREAPARPPAGLSYVFSSSSSERLREINNMIKTSRSAQRRRHAGSGHGGPAAKRPGQDEGSAWHRRLADVASERVAGRNQQQTSPGTKL